MNNNFSVLMSLYNGENPEYFYQCLESLSQQTLIPAEVLLVLDGEISQRLRDVIDCWSDKLNLNIIELPVNVGLSAALNIGLIQCSYNLVARMDTDDICFNNRFEVQYNFMIDNPNIDICGSNAIDIDEVGNYKNERIMPQGNDRITRLIWTCPFIHPSVFFRKDSILNVGSYNLNAPHRQDDYELWIRCANNKLTFENVQLFLLKYRFPESAISKNTFRVGCDRFLLGKSAIKKFDNRLYNYIALCYPMVRALIPKLVLAPIVSFFSRFDPRRN